MAVIVVPVQVDQLVHDYVLTAEQAQIGLARVQRECQIPPRRQRLVDAGPLVHVRVLLRAKAVRARFAFGLGEEEVSNVSHLLVLLL